MTPWPVQADTATGLAPERTVDEPEDLARADEPVGFLPAKPARRGVESIAVRLIATAGVIGIGTALGSILSANNLAGWITSLVVSIASVALSALLWRSRRL